MNAFYDREYAEEQEARRKAYRNSPEHERDCAFMMYRAGYYGLYPERPSIREYGWDFEDED